MSTDASVLALIDAEFGKVVCPEHFTNFSHCSECTEHDELLRSRSREQLTLQDVGNPGWDPLCFCSPEGLAYFLPSLARFALAETESQSGWYGTQLLFHLYSGFSENALYRHSSSSQRRAIAEYLAHTIETRPELIEALGATDEFLRCHELWSDTQSIGQLDLAPIAAQAGEFKR